MAAEFAPLLDFRQYVRTGTSQFSGRRWVFDQIQAWLSDQNSSRWFLITGEPGSGKTTLAARLAQFSWGEAETSPPTPLLEPDFLDAIHFCSAGDSAWTHPWVFVRSLAHQLSRHPMFASAVLEHAEQHGAHIRGEARADVVHSDALNVGVYIENFIFPSSDTAAAFQRLVRLPLETMYRLGFAGRITILVDAIDESLKVKGGLNIAALLASLENLPQPVRFILTSRPVSDLDSFFVNATELRLSDASAYDQNQRDLSEYVNTRLGAEKLTHVEEANLHEFVDTLVVRSDGNFRYAQLFLDAVAAGDRTIADARTLPAGLDDLYRQSFERLVHYESADFDTELCPLLGPLAATQEPLSTEQLTRFTGQSSTQLWKNIQRLKQFLEVRPGANDSSVRGESVEEAGRDQLAYVRLCHSSVADFLGRQFLSVRSGHGRNPFYIAVRQWHRRLAAFYLDHWGGLDHKLPGLRRPEVRDIDGQYGLRNVAYHLNLADAYPELFALVDERSWQLAQEDTDGSGGAFIADLEQAWDAAERVNQDGISRCGATQGITRDVQYAVTIASVRSRSRTLPGVVLAAMCRAGAWSSRRTLLSARLNPDPVGRLRTLSVVAPILEPPFRAEAIEEVMTGFSNPESDDAIVVMAMLLPVVPESIRANLADRAVSVADGTGDILRRAELVASLAGVADAAEESWALLARARVDQFLKDTSGNPSQSTDVIRARAIVGASLDVPGRIRLTHETIQSVCALKTEEARARVMPELCRALGRCGLAVEALYLASLIPPRFEREMALALAEASMTLNKSRARTPALEAFEIGARIRDGDAVQFAAASLVPFLSGYRRPLEAFFAHVLAGVPLGFVAWLGRGNLQTTPLSDHVLAGLTVRLGHGGTCGWWRRLQPWWQLTWRVVLGLGVLEGIVLGSALVHVSWEGSLLFIVLVYLVGFELEGWDLKKRARRTLLGVGGAEVIMWLRPVGWIIGWLSIVYLR